jgi:hypothetical protein
VLKMCQCGLLGLDKPAVVCVADVCGDYVSGDVAHGAEKFSWAPEMPFACLQACTFRCKVFPQPGMLAEQTEGASAFQQLQRLGNAHGGRQAHEQMHVIRLHLQLENFHPVFLRDFAQETFAVAADHCELKRIPGILGLPHQVECILPYPVAMTHQAFHFSTSAQNFCIAHANTNTKGGCANYAAHPPLRTSVENKEVTSKGERYRVRNSSAA